MDGREEAAKRGKLARPLKAAAWLSVSRSPVPSVLFDLYGAGRDRKLQARGKGHARRQPSARTKNRAPTADCSKRGGCGRWTFRNLAREDVMEGVTEIRIGATVPGGAKLATVHHPKT